jgi:putative transposase
MSYTQLLYHIVIRTKYSKKTIASQHAEQLYKYITGYIKNKKSVLYQINGMENHIHILASLHSSISLADFVKDLKTSSNLWMKSTNNYPDFTNWGNKYAAFSVSYEDKDPLIKYIQNQKIHHSKVKFEDEYRKLIIEAGINIDETYFLTD